MFLFSNTTETSFRGKVQLKNYIWKEESPKLRHLVFLIWLSALEENPRCLSVLLVDLTCLSALQIDLKCLLALLLDLLYLSVVQVDLICLSSFWIPSTLGESHETYMIVSIVGRSCISSSLQVDLTFISDLTDSSLQVDLTNLLFDLDVYQHCRCI